MTYHQEYCGEWNKNIRRESCQKSRDDSDHLLMWFRDVTGHVLPALPIRAPSALRFHSPCRGRRFLEIPGDSWRFLEIPGESWRFLGIPPDVPQQVQGNLEEEIVRREESFRISKESQYITRIIEESLKNHRRIPKNLQRILTNLKESPKNPKESPKNLDKSQRIIEESWKSH